MTVTDCSLMGTGEWVHEKFCPQWHKSFIIKIDMKQKRNFKKQEVPVDAVKKIKKLGCLTRVWFKELLLCRKLGYKLPVRSLWFLKAWTQSAQIWHLSRTSLLHIAHLQFMHFSCVVELCGADQNPTFPSQVQPVGTTFCSTTKDH